jgi:hypothetical protein
MPVERRRHSRKRPPKDVRADLQIEGMVGNLAKKVVDWSATGACLVTEGRLRPGATLRLELTGAGVNVRSNAIVRWSTTVERKGKTAHVCGLEVRAPKPAPAVPKDPKRRHARFPVKNVAETECAPSTWLSALGFSANVSAGVRDLSHGGIRLSVDRKMRIHQRVSLKLVFKIPNTTVEAEGVVRWCRRDTLSLTPKWDVGIVFRNVKDEMSLLRVERTFQDPS